MSSLDLLINLKKIKKIPWGGGLILPSNALVFCTKLSKLA